MAELALGHATTQRNCTYAIAEQAQVFAADAIENQVKTQDLLAEFQRTRESIIDPVEMAKANAAIEMMEITASQMVQVALNQSNICILGAGSC